MSEEQQQSNKHVMTRRNFIKTLGVMGGATLFSACAPVAPSAPSTSSTTTAPAAPTVPAVVKSKKLRYWTWAKSTDDNPRAKAQGMILDTFRKANPNIELVEEYIPWDQLRQQLLQAAAAGTAPDVSRQVDQYISDLASAGAILPLNEFTKSWGDDRKKDFSYPLEDMMYSGSLFGFRQALRPGNLLYYRTDLIPKAPKTWDEFQKAIVGATQSQISGYVLSCSKADAVTQILQSVPPMIWALGGDVIDPATSKPRYQEEPGVKVFQWLQDLIFKYKVMPPGVVTMKADDVDNLFLGGVAATIFQNNAKWGQWSTRDAIKGKVATAPFPNFANDPSKPGAASIGGAWALAMCKGAQKEEAWKFLEFMQSNEAEAIDAKVGGETPTRKSVLNDPWFKTEDSARIRDHLDWIGANPHIATTMRIKNMPQFADILGDAVQEILGRQADVKKTLADAAAKYAAQI